MFRDRCIFISDGKRVTSHNIVIKLYRVNLSQILAKVIIEVDGTTFLETTLSTPDDTEETFE